MCTFVFPEVLTKILIWISPQSWSLRTGSSGREKSSGLNQFSMDDYFCICMRCICIIGLLPNAQMLQIGTDKNQVSSLPSLFSPYSYLILKIQNFTQCHSEAVKHSKIQTIPFVPFLDFRNESQKMSKDQIIQIT